MRKAIASIDTYAGEMTIWYNGASEYMTAESDDGVVETMNAVAAPLDEDMAVDMVGKMYIHPEWGLKWLEVE